MIGTVKHSAPVGRNTRQHSDSAGGSGRCSSVSGEQPGQSFHPDTASPACPGRDSSPTCGAAAEQAPDLGTRWIDLEHLKSSGGRRVNELEERTRASGGAQQRFGQHT